MSICECGGEVKQLHNDYYDNDYIYKCQKCNKESHKPFGVNKKQNIVFPYTSKIINRKVKGNETNDFLPEFDYDEQSDVLYINFGIPEGCCGKEVGNGTTLFITPDGRYKGITIIDFKKRVLKIK